MDLVDSFVLPLPIDRAWDLLLDLEKIAPCMPGAQLTEIEGDEHRGRVKIKVGPITAQFAGQARFTEKNADAHRAVITADGREARGQGNANALVTAALSSVDGPQGPGTSTRVEVVTDLTISGKIAQFGRGVIADVSSKLISQFVANVEKMINEDNASAGGQPTPSAPAETDAPIDGTEAVAQTAELPGEITTPSAPIEEPVPPQVSEETAQAPSIRKIDSPEAEAVDLLQLTGAPLAKRLVPAAGAALVLALIVVLFRRRSR